MKKSTEKGNDSKVSLTEKRKGEMRQGKLKEKRSKDETERTDVIKKKKRGVIESKRR